MKSKDLVIRAFIGLLVLMLFGCNSTPATQAGVDLDAAIRDAAIQMESRISSGTMVALVSIASPSTAFSTQVLTRLESAIVSNGKLIVVDRANLDKIREEQGFQLSGEVNDESAKRIGQLLGAGAIVTGSLTDLGDVYSLTIKVINIETATIAVSYMADLAKTTRIETLLATRDGAGSGGTTTASATRPVSTAQTNPVQSTPVQQVVPVMYTVTFIANGASGAAPSEQTVQSGESITIPGVGTMTNSSRTFGGWNTRADGNGMSYAAGSALVVNTNIRLFASWIEPIYRIGDTGPAGGIIFYDKGNNSGGWRYLEAAPVDIAQRLFMSSEGISIEAQRSVGTGKSNTQAIMIQANNKGGGFGWAAQACVAYTLNGFNDWFLPSRDELNFMYGNLHMRNLGGFNPDWYWSSTYNESSTFNRYSWWAINFSDGKQETGVGNRDVSWGSGEQHRVRPIRQF